jgi:hypothetical protein
VRNFFVPSNGSAEQHGRLPLSGACRQLSERSSRMPARSTRRLGILDTICGFWYHATVPQKDVRHIHPPASEEEVIELRLGQFIVYRAAPLHVAALADRHPRVQGRGHLLQYERREPDGELQQLREDLGGR